MTKTRGRPFKPGQSGNPAGRPSNPDCLTVCLRDLADKPHRRGQTKAQALAAIVWRRALAGDLRAAALVYDRVEGKPGQRVEVDAGGQVEPLILNFGIADAVARANSELAAADTKAEAKSGGNRQ